MGTKRLLRRRDVIRLAGLSALSVAVPFMLRAAETRQVPLPGLLSDVQLGAPDANGMRLLPGYQSRIVARSGKRPVSASDYIWHDAPDGGATLAMADGGWVYVSNSEVDKMGGGVGALRFAADGTVVDAYSILQDTSRNCAGNMTPWGTYLSCEEIKQGQVWECDPLGQKKAQVRPLLGRFIHESVAFDPLTHQLYLTEDHPEGRLYRFTASQNDKQGNPDLDQGVLEVAQVVHNSKGYGLVWHPISDPLALRHPTRYQVKQSSVFRGGEGICYQRGLICFATKGDDRIWAYDTKSQFITLLYAAKNHPSPLLRGVDNVIPTADGNLLISEDGDNMQVITLSLSGQVQAFLQLEGHDRSELTGLAFSPDGHRLYVSSQRGPSGQSTDGVIFEISRL